MRFGKTFFGLLICAALVGGAVANAAAPCCLLEAAIEAQDMPCHEQEQNHETCHECLCAYGVVSVFAPPEQPTQKIIFSFERPPVVGAVYAVPADEIFQPPKRIS